MTSVPIKAKPFELAVLGHMGPLLSSADPSLRDCGRRSNQCKHAVSGWCLVPVREGFRNPGRQSNANMPCLVG